MQFTLVSRMIDEKKPEWRSRFNQEYELISAESERYEHQLEADGETLRRLDGTRRAYFSHLGL